MDVVQQIGIRLIAALQHTVPGLDGFMRLFTVLGREEGYILLISLVYWCLDRRAGIRLALLLLLSSEANTWAKLLFHDPRPYWLVPVLGRDTESSYGVPSGHAQNAVLVWFGLAAASRRRWAWPIAVVLVCLISLSRLYLGVHFPHDVVVGWILGGLALWVLPRALRCLEEWLLGRPLLVIAAGAAAISAGILVVSVAGLAALSGVHDPPAWAPFAANARSLNSTLMIAGMLFGGVLGIGLQEATLAYRVEGRVAARAARFVVGITGTALLLAGMHSLVPRTAGLPGAAFRFVM